MNEDNQVIVDIYYRVIELANSILKESSILSIEALKEIDPSVEELSKVMRLLANVLKEFAGDSWEDEKMALNAFQCCLTMERLAEVVANSDHDGLANVLKELEINTRVP